MAALKGGSIKGVLALLTVTLLWGTTFPITKGVVEELKPFEYVAFRFTMATAVMLPILLFKGLSFSSAVRGLILGTVFFLGIWLQTWGMTYTTASNAAFITGLNVIIVYAFEAAFYRRKPTVTLSASVLLAVAGLYLLSAEGASLKFNWGDILVLLSAFFWAVQVMLVDVFSKKCDLIVLNCFQLAATGLLGFTAAYATSGINFNVALTLMPQLTYLAVFCSTIALGIQILGQRYTTPTLAGIIFLMEPVFASAFAYILLGETMSLIKAAGATLIMVSTAAATFEGIYKLGRS